MRDDGVNWACEAHKICGDHLWTRAVLLLCGELEANIANVVCVPFVVVVVNPCSEAVTQSIDSYFGARVALLDPSKLGAKLCVLASVRLRDHDEAAITGFTALIARLPQVLECHSVSGNTDYILKIRVADVEAYEAFMTQNLLRSPYVRELVSSFVLKEIKATTAIPI